MPIRPVCPETDCQVIAAILNAFQSEQATVDQVRSWCSYTPPAGWIVHRLVTVDDQDQVTGYSILYQEDWWPKNQFYVWAGVSEAQRRKGLGSALFAENESFLRAQGAGHWMSQITDDDPAALTFAERCGFAIKRHFFASVLDLVAFDELPFSGIQPTLEKTGIHFFSLADIPDSPEARRQFYDLRLATIRDVPGIDGVQKSFTEFERHVFNSESYDPAAQMIAADGETWVGLTTVELFKENGSAYNQYTGVLAPYRGRHIALALKLQAIRYAREQGAAMLQTSNDSAALPMLAVNRKLGYTPRPGKYSLVRDVTGNK